MDVRQLRYFKAIAEAGSFTRAAGRVRIAQPALGLQMQKLEKELGVSLLKRHSRGVEATEAGALLLRHANIIIRQMDRACQEVTALSATPRGRISVGITPTASALLVTPLVRLCHQTWPEISLRIIEGLSEVVMQQLGDHALDIGFTYNPNAVNGISTTPLLIERLYLVRSSEQAGDDTVAFADACCERLILPRTGFGLRDQIEAVAAGRGLSVEVVLEVDSVTSMRTLAEGGIGSTILPYGSIESAVTAGRLAAARIVDPCLSRTLYVAVAGDQVETNASRAVRRLIDEVAAEIVATSAGRLTAP